MDVVIIYWIHFYFRKYIENKSWVQFRIGEFSDFLRTPHIYVFRRADYEYNSENFRLPDFHGKNHENHGFWRLSQPICKISQNVPNVICVDLIEIHIFCYMHFYIVYFLNLNQSSFHLLNQ